MSVEFWGEVVVTAVYLQNRLSTKSLASRTPYEAWHGRKPPVNHMRVFGCRAFVKQLDHVNKLTDRSRARVFIGYVEGASMPGHRERQRRLDRHHRVLRVHRLQVLGRWLYHPQLQSPRQVHSREQRQLRALQRRHRSL
jgi:hypothetical protein